ERLALLDDLLVKLFNRQAALAGRCHELLAGLVRAVLGHDGDLVADLCPAPRLVGDGPLLAVDRGWGRRQRRVLDDGYAQAYGARWLGCQRLGDGVVDR